MAALHGVIPERGDRLLPAVSALLAVIAFPPFHLLIPSFVALVPLAILCVIVRVFPQQSILKHIQPSLEALTNMVRRSLVE